jgi:imidazolonepropionase-like amidohydrolase
MAARELGMGPTSHADGAIAHALRFAQDGYPEHDHGFTVQPIYRDVVQLMAQSQIVIANANGRGFRNVYGARLDSATIAKLRRFTPPAALALMLEQTLKPAPADRASQWWIGESAGMAAIARAGGKIGVGQHGEIPGLGTQMEMWAYVDGGMPPMEALRAGTINGAQVLGFGKEMGTLEAGKLADLQILNANPLDNIRNTNTIRYVMKNGRLYDGETLDEVWPQQKKLDPPWWIISGSTRAPPR